MSFCDDCSSNVLQGLPVEALFSMGLFSRTQLFQAQAELLLVAA